MKHELKIWKEFVYDVKSGNKSFEVRKNDRGFNVADTILLRSWDNEKQEYTGDWIEVYIKYILHGPGFGVEEGFVVMAISVHDYNL